jgi:hypothetical protein
LDGVLVGIPDIGLSQRVKTKSFGFAKQSAANVVGRLWIKSGERPVFTGAARLSLQSETSVIAASCAKLCSASFQKSF